MSAQSTATSPMGRPAAPRAVAVSFTTSPVRTLDVGGSTEMRAIVLGSTCSARISVAGAEVAVIVARPALRARNLPSLVTVATRGLLEVNVTGSVRRSPCREKGVAETVKPAPADEPPGPGPGSNFPGGVEGAGGELHFTADRDLTTRGLNLDFSDLRLLQQD